MATTAGSTTEYANSEIIFADDSQTLDKGFKGLPIGPGFFMFFTTEQEVAGGVFAPTQLKEEKKVLSEIEIGLVLLLAEEL